MARERIAGLFDRVADWGERTFPGSTDAGRLAHLREEYEELVAAPSDGAEMADMVMILCHQARAHGVDLIAEIERKFAICQERTWLPPDEDGVVRHADPGMVVRIASDGDGGMEPRCVLCKRVLVSASNWPWRKQP